MLQAQAKRPTDGNRPKRRKPRAKLSAAEQTVRALWPLIDPPGDLETLTRTMRRLRTAVTVYGTKPVPGVWTVHRDGSVSIALRLTRAQLKRYALEIEHIATVSARKPRAKH